jgi:hypothetical protein
MRYIMTAFLGFIFIISGCIDQQENNLFDPANTFIRFDYNNAVNSIAKDSILLKRGVLDSLVIPIALSSAPRQDSVLITLEINALTGTFTEQVHFDISPSPSPANGNIQWSFFPGQYVHYLHFREIAEPPAGLHRVRLELTRIHPEQIHLGFPGSGRGKTFDVIYAQ